MAERVTDLQDIERRVVAQLVGEPEPGRRRARGAVRAGGRGPGAGRHRRARPARWCSALVTERGGPTSHTAIIARQLGIPCVVGVAGAMTLAGGAARARRRRRRHRRDRPGPAELGRAGRRPTRAARERARRRGPARAPPRDGVPVKILANVADGASARAAGAAPVQGVGLLPHRAVLPRPPGRAVRRGAGADLRRGADGVRRPAVRRRAHPRRRLRQAGRVRHARGARRTRRSASAACGCPSATRGCSTASSTASPRRPRRPAPRPG